MNLEQASYEEVELYLDLLGRFETEEAKRAFVFCHLAFGRLGGCQALVGRHGQMTSLRIYDDGKWCFAFAAAKTWTKAWIRPHEYRKGYLSLPALTDVLPMAEDRGDAHFTVRLRTLNEARLFCDLIAASRS